MIRRKLPRQLRAVIDLMILCGMRPNEALQLRMADVDTSRKPWLYTVPQHKTAHKGRAMRRRDRICPGGSAGVRLARRGARSLPP